MCVIYIYIWSGYAAERTISGFTLLAIKPKGSILRNSIALTSFVVTEPANTMKYGGGGLT